MQSVDVDLNRRYQRSPAHGTRIVVVEPTPETDEMESMPARSIQVLLRAQRYVVPGKLLQKYNGGKRKRLHPNSRQPDAKRGGRAGGR